MTIEIQIRVQVGPSSGNSNLIASGVPWQSQEHFENNKVRWWGELLTSN